MFCDFSHATMSRTFFACSAGEAYFTIPVPGLRRAAPFDGHPTSVTMMFLLRRYSASLSLAMRLLRYSSGVSPDFSSQ